MKLSEMDTPAMFGIKISSFMKWTLLAGLLLLKPSFAYEKQEIQKQNVTMCFWTCHQNW